MAVIDMSTTSEWLPKDLHITAEKRKKYARWFQALHACMEIKEFSEEFMNDSDQIAVAMRKCVGMGVIPASQTSSLLDAVIRYNTYNELVGRLEDMKNLEFGEIKFVPLRPKAPPRLEEGPRHDAIVALRRPEPVRRPTTPLESYFPS